VRVRIKQKPRESELDGVGLDRFERGSVYEVSASIGSWLIAQGYAHPEMRREYSGDDEPFSALRNRVVASNHPRRRSNDR
jgi:hypothetical protein